MEVRLWQAAFLILALTGCASHEASKAETDVRQQDRSSSESNPPSDGKIASLCRRSCIATAKNELAKCLTSFHFGGDAGCHRIFDDDKAQCESNCAP